ncbi:MAG TPA: hypothetical protein VFX59_19785 [Polyangiales bacterium]|nr:hypothetical protein [Polyangiales bacterium]
MKTSMFALALFLVASRVAAQAEVDACVADHKRVQTARESGHYLESLEAAAHCAQPSCPRLIRQDCAAWYGDLADSTPSIVLEVRDDLGHDLADASVTLGARSLDVHGRAVALDPGTHELRIEAARHVPRVERIVLRQGEKNRRVAITLQPVLVAHEFVARRKQRTLTPAVITLGAIGLAGLGTFAALAITGKVKRSGLDDCRPDCARDDVDQVNHMYLGANIAAAIGGSAAIAATVLYVLDRKRELQVGLNASGMSVRGAF